MSTSAAGSNNPQQLHFIQRPDGSIEVRGLLSGQKLLQMPDGRLSLINSGHQANPIKYSLNQIVQVKNDHLTLLEIETHFGPHQSEKVLNLITFKISTF